MNIHLLNLHFVFHLWASRTEPYTEDSPPICLNKLSDGKILQKTVSCLICPYPSVSFFQNTLKTQPLSHASCNNLGFEQNFDLLCTLECVDWSGRSAGGTDNTILSLETKVIWVTVLRTESSSRTWERANICHMLVGHLEWMLWNYREDHLLGWRIIMRTCRDISLLCLGSWPLLRALAIAVSPLLSYALQSFEKEWNT